MNEELDSPQMILRSRVVKDDDVAASLQVLLLHWAAYRKNHPDLSLIEYINRVAAVLLRNRKVTP